MYEVLLCFSVIQFGYSVCECFARGIDEFDKLIISGNFDRILLRPKNKILQVMTTEIDFIKSIRFVQAIIVMIIALIKLNIKPNLAFVASICFTSL